jgi:hypothetical protein
LLPAVCFSAGCHCTLTASVRRSLRMKPAPFDGTTLGKTPCRLPIANATRLRAPIGLPQDGGWTYAAAAGLWPVTDWVGGGLLFRPGARSSTSCEKEMGPTRRYHGPLMRKVGTSEARPGFGSPVSWASPTAIHTEPWSCQHNGSTDCRADPAISPRADLGLVICFPRHPTADSQPRND